MRFPRVRLTVFRLVLLISVVAIAVQLATSLIRSRADRCRESADWHARIGAEYRRNADDNQVQLKLAAWHEFMRREFERAANDPTIPVPQSLPSPPRGWVVPTAADAGG